MSEPENKLATEEFCAKITSDLRNNHVVAIALPDSLSAADKSAIENSLLWAEYDVRIGEHLLVARKKNWCYNCLEIFTFVIWLMLAAFIGLLSKHLL